MNQDQSLSLLRSIIIFFGSWLTAKGFLSSADAPILETAIMTIVGARSYGYSNRLGNCVEDPCCDSRIARKDYLGSRRHGDGNQRQQQRIESDCRHARDGGNSGDYGRAEAWAGEMKDMKMNTKTLAFLALAALPLAGCTSVENAVSVATSAAVPASTAVVAANSFDAIESIATGYISLPVCGGASAVCRTVSATKAIIPAIRSGRAARNAIKGLLCAEVRARRA